MRERPKSILIVGGDSHIGKYLHERLTGQDLEVTRTTRRKEKQDKANLHLDLVNLDDFKIAQSFDVAFICAGVTNITQCEEAPEMTTQINVHNTIKLIDKLASQGAFIVYLSSNVVFSGDTEKLTRDALTNPVCNYGKQKESVEKHLIQSEHNFSIIRLTKVIGATFTLLENWASSLLAAKSITAFSDLKMAPISMHSLIDVCAKLAANPTQGVFHLSGLEDASYAQVATYVAKQLKVATHLVHQLTSEEAGVRVTFKPKNTALGTQCSNEAFNFKSEHWTSIIDCFLKTREVVA
jgi:dTDP-4-dehydrorhamnose reductase